MKWNRINQLGATPGLGLAVAIPRLLAALTGSVVVGSMTLGALACKHRRADDLAELEFFLLTNLGLGLAEIIPFLGLVVHDHISDRKVDEFYCMGCHECQ